MVRSSSVHRICTHRPDFDYEKYNKYLKIVEEKVLKKRSFFDLELINDYCELAGIMTDAKKLRTLIKAKYLAENDPLPDGAKTYLQEIWLENNMGFYNLSQKSDAEQFVKGHLCEDNAIDLVGKKYNIVISKNLERTNKGFLTGECDVEYQSNSSNKIIRDIKCPYTWNSFRSKTGIPLQYKWQLVAYCYLYEAQEAYIDYVLLPCPPSLISSLKEKLSVEDYTKFLSVQESISKLDINQSIKTFKYQGDLNADIEFMKTRLVKANEYYNNLNYETCMQFNL